MTTRTLEGRDRMCEIAHAVARILIASYFLALAGNLVSDPTGMGQFLANAAMPDYMRWPNTGFEFLAALAILVGFQTRTASALLALYVFWSSFILNYRPADPVAMGVFWRDLAMIGGLLMLFSHGRGRYAIDNLFVKSKQDEKTAEAPRQHQPREIEEVILTAAQQRPAEN